MSEYSDLSDPDSDWPERVGSPSILGRAVASVSFVVLVSTVAFLGSWGNRFVDYDDDINFVDNPGFRGLGWTQVRWAWETTHLGVFQPLAWMLFELEYALGGLRPWVYHISSILLHVAVCIALVVLTRRLITWRTPGLAGKRSARAWAVSGVAVSLFAAHPLRAEVVAWVSCQPYLPCTFFGILCVLAYLRAARLESQGHSRGPWLVLSVLLMAVSLLFKAPTVALPLVLLILDWYLLRRLSGGEGESPRAPAWHVWGEKILFVAIGLPFMFLAYISKGQLGLIKWSEAGIGARLAQAVMGVWFYLGKSAWPADLSPFYLRPQGLSCFSPLSLAALAALLAVTLACLALRSRWPALLAGWGAYLVLLAPVSGLVMVGSMFASDRYTYVAMMPLFVLLAAGLFRLVSWREGIAWFRGMMAVGVVGVMILVGIVGAQCDIWTDPETLWLSAVNRRARIPEIHNCLGLIWAKQGKTEEAIAAFRKSLELGPNDPWTLMNLGSAQAEAGELAGAITSWNHALKIPYRDRSIDLRVHRLLGDAYLEQGDPVRSALHYRFSIRLDPWHPEVRRRLAQALELQGLKDQAARERQQADQIETRKRF
jgi:tetratricopeptide (TPR) repeat protein